VSTPNDDLVNTNQASTSVEEPRIDFDVAATDEFGQFRDLAERLLKVPKDELNRKREAQGA
jgi:hypothetical protein